VGLGYPWREIDAFVVVVVVVVCEESESEQRGEATSSRVCYKTLNPKSF